MRPQWAIAGLAALTLACGLAASASANMPVKDWEVGPINAASSSGVGFCSMKNSFQDGQMLVVARDAEGSNSLAISFPEKILQAGGQYTVSVSAENVKRQMVGLAGTPQVLILQMGLDREFYLALQKKHSLAITLKDKELNFSLDSTGDALEALTKCANDIAAGKKFEPVMVSIKGPLDKEQPIVPPDGAVRTDFGKQAAEDTLRDEVERLKLENAKLLAESRETAAKLAAAQKTVIPAGKPATVTAAAPVPVPKIVAKKDTFLVDLLHNSKLAAKKDGEGYAWEVKDLYGAAEEHPLQPGGIQAAVNDYVEKAKAKCQGDFAHNEGELKQTVEGLQLLEGEFACINNGDDDAAAALLFVSRNGKVDVIAHEGSTDQMEDALTKRSEIISNITR